MTTPIDMNAMRIAESLGNLAGDQAQDAKVEGKQFGDVLKEIVTETDRLQDEAGTKVEDFSKGKTDDVHDVMMAMSKADVSFRMMLEVRNKLVEAYQEVMRIQV